MPLYEYQCEACGHQFELIRKFSDPPVEKCPVCGGPVQKLMSSPAFQFKGSGWYITDYARKEQGGKGSNHSAGENGAKDKGDKAAASTEKTEKTEKADAKGESKSTASGDSASAGSTTASSKR